MEPADIKPLHCASHPQLDDKGDGEAGLEEEEEFEDLGEFSSGPSWSPLGFAESTNSPSSLRQPSPTLKPATHQPNCSFNHPVKQSQPTASVNLGSGKSQTDVEGQDCYTESCVHLTNGYSESAHKSGNHTASAVSVCSPREETGFADFTVFAEQAAHPWCCGFTPLGSTEKWDGRAVAANSSSRLGKQICDPGREVFMDSDPGPHCAYKAKEKDCPKVRHCEKRDAPAQDHHEPQEIAGALGFPPEEPNFGEETSGRDSQMCKRNGVTSLQTTEVQENEELEEERGDQEKSISAAPQTFSMYDSVSEDLASFCDDFSFEGPSADLEPNVSSLGSEEQTDWDQTGDEEEELGNYSSLANLRQSKTERGLQYGDPSSTQETLSTSNRSQPGTHTEDSFADFKDCSLECDRDQGHVQTVDAGVLILGTLPPSDSFADFCSAPMQDDGEESLVEFKEQKFQERGRTWSREQVSSLQTEDEDRAGRYGVTRGNSCEASLSVRVQQLFLASFPALESPAAVIEEEVFSLRALLHTQHLPKSEKGEIPELCPAAQRIQRGVWWPHQDLHTAVGLKFHWGGSHANLTLLRCLGVDTKNIVFIGIKKQPVTVPAFASNLCMLEPTKESVSAVCSPGHTAATAQATPGLQDPPAPSADSMHEVLPPSRLDWSSRGLSSSQDVQGEKHQSKIDAHSPFMNKTSSSPAFSPHNNPLPLCPLVSTGDSALNLDYFGPEEARRSHSSSRSNSPPPGVDRELYELTVSKTENSNSISHMEDALNHLMSTAFKTSTSIRKPQQNEELSAEADNVITGLPELSFMRAKVLMFPSIFTPEEFCSTNLQ